MNNCSRVTHYVIIILYIDLLELQTLVDHQSSTSPLTGSPTRNVEEPADHLTPVPQHTTHQGVSAQERGRGAGQGDYTPLHPDSMQYQTMYSKTSVWAGGVRGQREEGRSADTGGADHYTNINTHTLDAPSNYAHVQ